MSVGYSRKPLVKNLGIEDGMRATGGCERLRARVPAAVGEPAGRGFGAGSVRGALDGSPRGC